MPFQKAADLLRLAEPATARHQGVSLTEIKQEFPTAQRMTRALGDMLPQCITRVDDERRRF